MAHDEMKLHRQRAKGQEALRLMENSMIQEFFTQIENEISDGWRNSKGDERELREQIYVTMRVFQTFKQKFKTCIATGKLAAAEIAEIERKKKQ